MPAANPTSIDVDTLSKRIPKLAVRNRTTDDAIEQISSTPPAHADGEHGSRPTISTHSSFRTDSHALRNLSDQSSDSLERLRTKTRNDNKVQEQKAAKKKGGVLGFLTLKEPSTSAWEEFAETQRKFAESKGGKLTTVGVTGVSSKKLPEHVPKTNSKWDGIPDNMKRKSIDANSKRGSLTSSRPPSDARRQSGGTAHSGSSGERYSVRKIGDLSNKHARGLSSATSHTKRDSVQGAAFAVEPRKRDSQFDRPIVVQPVQRHNVVTPSGEPPEVEQQAGGLVELASPVEMPVELESPMGGPLGLDSQAERPVELETPRGTETFANASFFPLLPDIGNLIQRAELPAQELPFERDGNDLFNDHAGLDASLATAPAGPSTSDSPSDEHRHPRPDSDRTFWASDKDADNEGNYTWRPQPTSLKQPLNFSRPIAKPFPSPARIPEGSRLDAIINEDAENDDEDFQPTLRDDKGWTSPFIFEQTPTTPQPHIRQASVTSDSTAGAWSTSSPGTATTSTTLTYPSYSPNSSKIQPFEESDRPASAGSDQTAEDNDAVSIAPSIAPSEMSAQWKLSPKERLGLGGKVTKRVDNDARLPWEGHSGPVTPADVLANAKRLSSMSDGSKLKRLSMKLGGRR